jgi:CHAT domain
VKLVFLQACESAMPTQDLYAPYQALSNVARCLASVSIPAVVAMQSKVELVTANTFAKAFYESLVQMMPVYQAVQVGRKTIPDVGAFGIPVCYLLRYSNEVGVLFPASDQPPPAISGAIGLSPGGAGRIRCVWCGEMSRRASKCSNCLGQLHCPNSKCPRFVEFQPGDSPLGETEKYVCECGAAFIKDGALRTVGQVDDFTRSAKPTLV